MLPLPLPLFTPCQRRRLRSRGWGYLMGLLLSIGLESGPALGAERVTISYGVLERSIAVESLEQYAQDGTIAKDLRSYTQLLDESQRQQLQQALSVRADLGVVAVSQFLYTAQGEILLQRLGEVVRTDANLSGFYALRSALILAADSPEGLTFLNVLRQFPLSNIRIDLGRTLQILGELQQLIRETQAAVALIDQQAATEAAAQSIDPNLPSLQRLGGFAWQRDSLEFRDPQRRRQLPVDLYLPQQRDQTPVLNAPIVVISHGLGSDRYSYAYLARQLASYGFAVAVLEHPGSNAQQLQALIAGTVSEVTAPSEFVDRPLDVKYVLDRLEELNRSEALRGRLNLDQVGVVGQSFGGYTALALAGAAINFEQLTADCAQGDPYNLSLLLQCRALELSQPVQPLSDARVKAVVAINPIGSSLLGARDFAQIRVPLMIIGGSADTVTPVLLEQIRPFTWLTTPDRYLVILQGATHFSTIDVPPESANAIQLPSELVGPDPALAKTYLNVLGTAFFQTYLTQNPTAREYLAAAYVETLNRLELPVALVQSLSLDQAQLDGSRSRAALVPLPAQPTRHPGLKINDRAVIQLESQAQL